jgi:hypothetical protein
MIKYIYSKSVTKKREKEMIPRKIYSLMFGIIFFFLMMIVPIMADNQIGIVQSLPPVKQGECVLLPQSCATCSYNNISSVTYPNSTIALGQVQMIKNGNSYSYNFCNTTALGKYIVNGFGDPSGSVETWAYDFEVTTTGQQNNNTIPIMLAIAGFIIFIIAIISRNLYIGFISGIVFIVLGIYLMIFGLGSISDFYTQTLSYVSLGFGLLIFLSAAYEAITDTGIHLWRKGGEDEW